MVRHESRYRRWLEERGVGANGRTGSLSRNSYVSRLNRVARVVGQAVGPENRSCAGDVERLTARMTGVPARPLADCRTAMRRYAAMVGARAHV